MGQELSRRRVHCIPVTEALKIAMQFPVTIIAEARPPTGLVFQELDFEFAEPGVDLVATDDDHFVEHFFDALGRGSEAFEVGDEFVDVDFIGWSRWEVLGVVEMRLTWSTHKRDGGGIGISGIGIGDKQESDIVEQT